MNRQESIEKLIRSIKQYLGQDKLTRACFLTREQYELIVECLEKEREKA